MANTSGFTSEILHKRLVKFALDCQGLVRKLSKSIYNLEYGRQLIRSSSSPSSNYIEAVEASSKRDFIYRLKICRKETKESIYWLTLVDNSNKNVSGVQETSKNLIKEGRELLKIFASSVTTAERNQKIKR
ncbi:four helix bundle protein [Patescibacteria group bacterium]|nr:four helix bundle protein [Patescibacteria group bacterium]